MLYGPEFESGKIFSLTADAPEPEPVHCGGCGKRVASEDELTWLGNGWDFLACPSCVVECQAADEKETGCTPEEIHSKPVQSETQKIVRKEEVA